MITNKEFRRIYLMQVLLAVADAMAFNFMMLYLLGRGFELTDLIVATTLAFSLPVVLIAVMRRARAKVSFLTAFAAKIAAYLIALFLLGPVTMKFLFIANALVLVFFWIPYNFEFFSFATEKNRAYSGSIAISIYPLVALAVPPLAAVIWRSHGFRVNMVVSILVLSTSAIYMLLNKAIKLRKFDYDIAEALRSLRGYKLLFALQGYWEASIFVGVPVFTLLFIDTELKLGFFFSYLGALSVAGTISLARLSDRVNRRTAFLYPAVLLAASATVLLGFAVSPVLWVAFVGVFNFANVIATPFLIAVALDARVTGIRMWAGRELLLNLGRAMGAGTLLAAYRITGSHRPGFVILGIALLAYPVLLHLRGIYTRGEIIPSQPAK
jgi:hypothetical protein